MSARLATRGSELALWQASRAREALGGTPELVVVDSRGDRDLTTELARFGSIGIFTVEVDRAVLDGRADVGVHSLKDMTTTLQDGVVLAGVLERGAVEDCLVSREPGWTLAGLPEGARVGTGSQRRGAMLLAARPDLELVPIRGNVATRAERVAAGDVDATVLARAGLTRLGMEHLITEVLDVDRFLPAVGQGIVGLTCRADDADTRARLEAEVRDASAWACARAERAFLRAVQGGCNAPIGGHATLDGDGTLRLRGRVLSLDGQRAHERAIEGPQGDAESIGTRLADALLADGAGELIAEARARAESDG
ncbi:MAG: hydroxymethylbilane synthase [Planctomycetota bacterium]